MDGIEKILKFFLSWCEHFPEASAKLWKKRLSLLALSVGSVQAGYLTGKMVCTIIVFYR